MEKRKNSKVDDKINKNEGKERATKEKGEIQKKMKRENKENNNKKETKCDRI